MNGMAGMMGLRLPDPKIGCSRTREIVPMLSPSTVFAEVTGTPTGVPASADQGAHRSTVRHRVPRGHHGTEEVSAVMTSTFPWPLLTGSADRPATRAALLGRLAGTFRRHERPRPVGMPPEEPSFRTCVAFDIVAFGARSDDEVQVFVHRNLYAILELGFVRAGIAWDASRREDRGDGALIIVPPATAPAMLVGPLVAELATCLRRYNKLVADVAQIRLRMAVHHGPVYADPDGLVGSSLVHLFRLLDAPAFKRALSASGADLGVVASERLYRDVIEPSRSGAPLGDYEPIEVNLKETRSPAWVYVPDDPRPAALHDLPVPA